MQIYVDESADGENRHYFLTGTLFIPRNWSINDPIWKIKDDNNYFDTSPKHSNNRYREFHFSAARSARDARVGEEMIEIFLSSDCWMRVFALDWSIWDSKYFGYPWEPDMLKKRRAYKKWLELLIQPELHSATYGQLLIDSLSRAGGYDMLAHLRDRFGMPYKGGPPRLSVFEMIRSWKDAHQGVQLCDLVLGCVKQALIPSTDPVKLQLCQKLQQRLQQYGVTSLGPKFWKGYSKTTLRKHFPKFSVWYWKPG